MLAGDRKHLVSNNFSYKDPWGDNRQFLFVLCKADFLSPELCKMNTSWNTFVPFLCWRVYIPLIMKILLSKTTRIL
jgi:hypothetical protein